MSRGGAAAHGEAGASTRPLRSVVKTFAVIDALIERGEASAAELAEIVDEPRSSVYRMLRTLQGLELVEVGTRRGLFRPGVGLVRMGGQLLSRFDERTVAMPALDRLRAETKETVHLVVRRGFQAVFIERLPGERPHILAISLGGTLPLHVGAAPRTLLAYEPRSLWDDYFAVTTIEQWTERSPVDEAGVRARLEEILASGVAFSDEDVVIGVATVAAPIFDHRGKIVASLAFNLFPEQLRSERETWAVLARRAGMDASRAFGYSGPAAPQATDEA
jgi:DNA-binding IclR family transcriptional regulator